MSIVTIVGLAAGGLLILTAIAVFWSKRDFPTNGLGATLIGFLLIGMSQWSSMTFKGLGIEIETLQKQVEQVATASVEVAEEARHAAANAETMRIQVANLTRQLEVQNALRPQDSQAIRSALDSAPRVNTDRLRGAVERLETVFSPRPQARNVPRD